MWILGGNPGKRGPARLLRKPRLSVTCRRQMSGRPKSGAHSTDGPLPNGRETSGPPAGCDLTRRPWVTTDRAGSTFRTPGYAHGRPQAARSPARRDAGTGLEARGELTYLKKVRTPANAPTVAQDSAVRIEEVRSMLSRIQVVVILCCALAVGRASGAQCAFDRLRKLLHRRSRLQPVRAGGLPEPVAGPVVLGGQHQHGLRILRSSGGAGTTRS
jgi:hypothetical protein